MQQISRKDDAELCKQVLAAVTLVYRPITLNELVTLVAPLEDLTSNAELQEIIGLCGSFLTLREQTLHFVHQSAKDFLLAKATQEIFPAGQEAVHQAIFARSLQVMSTTLQRDMYRLRAIGTLIEDVKKPKPDPLAAISYSCIYWIDHLCESKPIASTPDAEHLRDGGLVDQFLKKTFLYWLESLSLCKSMSYGVVSMNKLHMLAQVWETTSLTRLVYDAYRFIMYHRQTIEISPLQTYISALLFSPTDSLIRKSYHHEAPEYISFTTTMASTWDACLQTLEGHRGTVSSVAFSHDSSRIVSGSFDRTAKIWDASSGACLLTLRDHDEAVSSVAFSHNSSRVVSGSHDTTAKIWDTNSGACLLTFRGHSKYVCSVAFSYDSSWIASGSGDFTVKIWNSNNGECIQKLEHGDSAVHSVTFSRNSTQLISGSISGSIKIWDVTTGECLRTYKGDSLRVISMAFSHDSAHLVSGSDDGTIRIWDAISIASLRTPRNHNVEVRSLDFSPDSALLASAFSNDTIKIWHVSSGKCLQTLKYHDYKGIENKDIKHEISSMTFSHDSILLASGSQDGVIKIWNVSNGKCLHTLLNNGGYFGPVAMSHDLSMIAVLSYTPKIRIWHTWNGKRLQTLESHRKGVVSIAFSHDSTLLASGSPDNTVNIWDIKRGVCLQTYTTETYISKMKFENAGPYLHIGIGTINISAALDVSSLSNNSKPCVPRFHGVSVSWDSEWIKFDSKLVARIPRAYRAQSSIWARHGIVSGNTIAFSNSSEIVSIFKVDVDKLSVLEL
ncbi:WD40-repeat-containing domain protein [Bipolaris maydis]|nr:WD40-repeat-containing domain protein [Bipolaris maydis]